ncbi:metallophosphoesterase [Streptomyces sp. HNM0574]|uniref:metallophosphoesterase n=1 Tax=Streptomyces sp. HNM0574 TaxID=2714954 RepID=UPI001469DC23|nr:metallophosphoesterase [Streptomyces sp. HNM0574]NLU66811.1 metallophosphoesterase [Streptomyces sp. HNM0574]
MGAVFALVALLMLGVIGCVHWYLWKRLVRDVSVPGGPWRRTGTVLAVLLPVVAVANFVLSRAGVPFGVTQVLAWPGYLWLALMLYLLLALVAGELLRGAALLYVRKRRRAGAGGDAEAETEAGAGEGAGAGSAGHVRDVAGGDDGAVATVTAEETAEAEEAPAGSGEAPKPAASRRVFLARTLAVGAGVAGAGTVGAGAYGVLNGPTLKHVTVPLTKLPRAAHGYRIAVVSDVHLGPILGRAHTQRIVDTINSAQPDLVAIVGDLVDGTVEDLAPAAEPLRGLRSRHGSFFVTGNHEYFGDAGEWVDHVRELGVRPLENARLEMPYFDLAGVNDVQGEEQGEGPDFGKALGDRDTSRASVLLAHQPVQIHEAVDHGVDLQLSGHTHGGQLWPGEYLAGLANPTVAGLERYGDTQLYVTRGAGAWGPPVRVGAESDVTLVRLASRQT